MQRLFVLFAILLSLTSCGWISGPKNLGSGYYVYTDNNLLLYTGGKLYKASAYQVVPSRMLIYKNNEDFLITKCLNKRGDMTFWIVETEQ